MSVEVKVPVLPESVTDAVVAVWHKKVGDAISRDENLVDLETDKVVLEVPAPSDGVVKAIEHAEGATVTSGQLLAVIEAGAAATATPADSSPASASNPASSDSGPAANELSPAVRRLVTENDLDVSQIAGSGRDGRITKEDVVKHLEGAAPSAAPTAPTPASTPTAESAPPPAGARPEERVPMTRLRSKIAERMVAAQTNAAMLTTFNEVDLSRVIELRKQYKESFINTHDVKLGFMSFFVKACAAALRKFPVVNAYVDGNDVVYHGYQDIGIAVSTERGLMVPVLRDAATLSLAEIEKSIREYAGKARDGSIQLADLQGGTFTITNGGIFGSMMSTPILNPPQSAILGMHAIKERPVVVNGEIVARPMMYLALSYDHRIIDGKDSVQFLVAIKDALEDPARLLLDV